MGQTTPRSTSQQDSYACCENATLGDLDFVEFPAGPSSIVTTAREGESPFTTARLGEAVKALQRAMAEERLTTASASSSAAVDSANQETDFSETPSPGIENTKIETPDGLRRKRKLASFYHGNHNDRRNLKPWGVFSFRQTEESESHVKAHLVGNHTDRNHLRSCVAGHVNTQEDKDTRELAFRRVWAVPVALAVHGCQSTSNCCCSVTKATPARLQYNHKWDMDDTWGHHAPFWTKDETQRVSQRPPRIVEKKEGESSTRSPVSNVQGKQKKVTEGKGDEDLKSVL